MLCDSHLHIAECENFVPAHFAVHALIQKKNFLFRKKLLQKAAEKFYAHLVFIRRSLCLKMLIF